MEAFSVCIWKSQYTILRLISLHAVLSPYPLFIQMCLNQIEISLLKVENKPIGCHHASFYNLLLPFFTSFPSPLPNFLTLVSHLTHSHPMTRQRNTIILVQDGLAIRGGLWFYATQLLLHQDGTSFLSLRDVSEKSAEDYNVL